MLSGRRRYNLKAGAASAALAAGLLAASASYAQDQATPAPQAGPASERPQSEVSTFVGSLIPGFEFNAGVNLSETYATNAGGTSFGRAQDDWITTGGIFL